MATIPASLKTAVAAPKVPDYIILYGEMPPAVSYLTEKGKTVFFYKGYHVATDPEVVEYCKTIPGIRDVTSEVKLEDVPKPESRTRNRNWESGGRSTVTPQDLLRIAVANSKQIPAAESNS